MGGAPSSGLVRARFGLGKAPSGVSAARKKGFEGRSLSPRKGGARLFVVNGMVRGATQELGGMRSPAVTGGVYAKARSEEVAPDMRSALDKARAGLEVEMFVRGLGRDMCVEASEALGSEKGAESRVWPHQFRSVRE